MFEKIDLKAKMSEMPNIDTIMVLSVFEFINTFFKRFHLPFPKDLHRCDWIPPKTRPIAYDSRVLKKKKHQIKFQVYFSKNNGMTENNNTIEEEARKPTR